MRRPFDRQNPQSASESLDGSSDEIDFELQIVRGRTRHPIRPISNGAFLLGSADDCDLVLGGDPRFPEAHALIRRGPSGLTLRRLGAEPAIWVNEQPLAEARVIRDGDQIRTGPFEFVVQTRASRLSSREGIGEGDSRADEVACDAPVAKSADALPQDGMLLARALLADIRSAFSNGASALRLYVEQDPTASPGDRIAWTSSPAERPASSPSDLEPSRPSVGGQVFGPYTASNG